MKSIASKNIPCQCASEPNKVLIYADGLCEPVNPGGYGCWGWVAFSDEFEITYDYGCIGIGKGVTNNVAEYYGVIQALKFAETVEKGIDVDVLTDSQLVANQINGEWQCRSTNLIPLCIQAIALIKKTNAKIRWVPRDQNKRADELTRIAYREVKNKLGGTK